MDVYASPNESPELKDFLGTLQIRFRRAQGRSLGALPDGTAHGAAQQELRYHDADHPRHQ
jgi:hypothetical protein